jgi:DNA mismatch repair ATPase MutS
MTLQVNGIIATHDLQLGTLADVYPGQIKNYCFEADITHNELTFSPIKSEKGCAKNMNACFLMKKMGIAIGLTDTKVPFFVVLEKCHC